MVGFLNCVLRPEDSEERKKRYPKQGESQKQGERGG